MKSETTNCWNDLAARCSVDADAGSPHGSGALDAADVSLQLDALPFDLLPAENEELEDALVRLHGGGRIEDQDASPVLVLSDAVAGADGNAVLLEILAVDTTNTPEYWSENPPADPTSESALSDEVDGSSAVASVVAVETAAISSSSGSSATSSSAESDHAKDSNPTRRRIKQELDHLHQRVTELQATLNALQQSQPNNATVAARKPDDAWEGVANRQRDLRLKAELENAKLREALKAQLQLAKSLERLLHKRPSLWTNDAVSSKRFCGTTGRVSGIIDAGGQDATVFETLIAKIDQSYASYRETLTANGLLRAPTGFRATNVKPTTCSGGESVCVELLDVKRMPFEANATCSAAWRCITSGYMQLEHKVYRGFEGASDVLAIKYAVTMTRKRLSVDFTARAVMKKFVDNGRVVFVWESLSDTDGTHCGAPRRRNPGIQVQEQGWTVFSSQEQHGDTDDNGDYQQTSEPSTRILTCMRMTPLVSSPSASASVDFEDEGRQVGLLTNLSLDYFGEQLDHAHEAIESLLLDERSR